MAWIGSAVLMPKSRSRRTRTTSPASRRQQRRRRYDEAPALRQRTMPASSLLAEPDWASIRAAADAELSGDPAAALRYYERVDSFHDSPHHRRLRQLADLGDQAPGWLWSRWMTVQARRPLWTGSASGERCSELETALRVAYPHGIDTRRMEDMSLPVFVASLHERDWVTRQLIVYEAGGLRHLVEQRASPRLLEGADQPAAWASAPMGGYRLDSDDQEHLRMTDLSSGASVEILDLGLAEEHAPGAHLLGRLVPTATAPGRMFEWRPLPVDEQTAARVAADPAGWLDVVAERAACGALPMMFSYVGDTLMSADLPARYWLGLLEPDDVDRLPADDGLIDYADVHALVLPKLLKVAEHAPQHLPLMRHFAETLLLEPGVHELARARFTGYRRAVAWWAIAGVVREPARGRCLELAALRRGGAAGGSAEPVIGRA